MGRDPAAVPRPPSKDFAADLPVLAKERFGPAGPDLSHPSVDDLVPALAALAGNLVGSVHGDTTSAADVAAARQVIAVFERTVGRIVSGMAGRPA